MEEKTEQFGCWVNEQESIISFRAENGYVRKEFETKEEFHAFLLSIATNGYKVK